MVSNEEMKWVKAAIELNSNIGKSISDAVNASMSGITGSIKEISGSEKQWKSIADVFASQSLAITQTLNEIGVINVTSKISDLWNEAIITIHEQKIKADEKHHSLLSLSKINWYLDEDLDKLSLLMQKLERNEGDYVDRFLVKYYKRRFAAIMAELVDRHPSRKDIFDEIIFCRKRKMLHSAILCVLSQIDGISKDITNGHFFRYELAKGGQMRSQAAKNIIATFPIASLYFFAPIMSVPEISAKFDDDSPVDALNRHSIMHGYSIKYGTEANFFKSISLLKYMSDVLIEYQIDRQLLNK